MFVIFGLVLGSLVGFVTSLFRARAMSGMMIASNLGCAVLAILSLIALFITNDVGRGGDAGMAMITIIAISVGSVLSILLASSIVGNLLNLINQQGIIKNIRSTGVDVVLLSIVFLLGQAAVVNTFASAEEANMKRARSEMQSRIEQIESHIPLTYQGMDSQTLRFNLKKPRLAPIPNNLLAEVSERDLLKSKLTEDYGLAQFIRNNERRQAMFWSSIVGWLVTIFAFPFSSNKRGSQANMVT